MCFSFFIAANTGDGFVSLFDEINNYDQLSRRYIIKGGPGSGKSTFMKKLGEKYESQGFGVEYLYCSSDPDSLDGIICLDANISVVDGTAPHIIEPKIIGAVDNYINFSQFWDSDKLYNSKDDIVSLQSGISENYKSAYKFLSCAKILKDEILSDALESTDVKRLKSRISGITKREIPKSKEKGLIHKRFLRANSYKENTELLGTIKTFASKIYSFKDTYGLSSIALNQILAENISSDIYVCYSPLDTSKIEHIIIPELSLAFTSNYPYKATRNINLDAYCELKPKNITDYNEIYKILMNNAKENLSNSKKLHDDLEEKFIDAMDYTNIDRLLEKF